MLVLLTAFLIVNKYFIFITSQTFYNHVTLCIFSASIITVIIDVYNDLKDTDHMALKFTGEI